jgi:hypothetical protein
MPDTGPPWNIPYVEPTDNPRVYPAASEDLADAIADGLDAAGNAGIGSNVVQTVKTDTFSTASSTFTALTGLSVTITPTSDTAKVLVIVALSVSHSESFGNAGMFRLLRGATGIYLGSGASTENVSAFITGGPSNIESRSLVFVDSPGVATATTYSLEVRRTDGTVFVNRRGNSADFVVPSSITAIEVAV